MSRKNLNYKSPFDFCVKVSKTPFEFRAPKVAHLRLELNRLNTYIAKIQDKLSVFLTEKSKRGAYYRNLNRRLQLLKERKVRVLTKYRKAFPSFDIGLQITK